MVSPIVDEAVVVVSVVAGSDMITSIMAVVR